MKPIYAEVYEQGVEKGYEVANVKTYYDENGQAKIETVVHTPYYDENGRRVIGSGIVNATHGEGLREVADVDLLFDDFGQMSLFDENGNAVDKETMKTEMSQYMSAASEYPHVASYDEWYDNQKHNYEKVKLDAEPTKSDYVKYLDNVSRQMASGDIKFVGPLNTQQNLQDYMDNFRLEQRVRDGNYIRESIYAAPSTYDNLSNDGYKIESVAGKDKQSKLENVISTPYYDVAGNRVLASGTLDLNNPHRIPDDFEFICDTDLGELTMFDKDGQSVDYDKVRRESVKMMLAGSEYSHVAHFGEWLENQQYSELGLEPTVSGYKQYLDDVSKQMANGDVKFVGAITTQQDLDTLAVSLTNNQQIKNSYDDVYEQGVAKGYEISSVRTASIDAGQRDVLGYGESAVISMKTPYFDSKGSAVTGLASVPLVKDAERQSNTVEFLVNGYNMDYILGGDRKLYTNTGSQVNVEQARQEMGQFAAAGSNYPHVSFFEEWKAEQDRKNNEIGLESVPGADVSLYLVYLDYMANKMNNGQRFVGDIQTINDFGKAQESIKFYMVLHPDYAQEADYTGKTNSNKIDEYLAKVRDNGGIDALKSDDVVYDPVMSMKEDLLKNILDNMRKAGTFPKDKTQEKSEHVKMITPQEVKTQEQQAESVMHVDNINDYVLDLVQNGAKVYSGKKTATVHAEQGIIGDVITTDIDKTENTVGVDEFGNPDWVITNPGGEKYVVKDKVFKDTYEQAGDEPGVYSKKALQLLVPCEKSVEFTPSWGGSFTVEKGGYFTINDYNKIAGVQKEAFEQTYEIVSQSYDDVKKAFSVLTNGEKSEPELTTTNLAKDMWSDKKKLQPVLDVDAIHEISKTSESFGREKLNPILDDMGSSVSSDKLQIATPNLQSNFGPKSLPPILDVDDIVHSPNVREGDFDGNKVGVLKADSNSRKLPENGEALLSALENSGHDGHDGHDGLR